MKINGSFTTKSNNWNQIKKHVDRNWTHDINEKNIDKNLSKYNQHDKSENINYTNNQYKNYLLKNHYQKFIDKRNHHFVEQGHKKRCKTLKEYLKNKTPTAIGIATFGTLKDKSRIQAVINLTYSNRSQKENKKRFLQACSRGLARYCKNFNKRNKYIKIDHYWTNVDEIGAPHVHFEIIPLGYTKLDKNGNPTKPHKKAYKSGKNKGKLHKVTGSKPSGNLTNAVEMEMHTNNNRKAFRQWNDIETKQIVKTVGNTFRQRFSKVHNWSFSRQHTGRTGSLSMRSYKATWQKFDQIKKQQRAREIHLNHQKKELQPTIKDYHFFKHWNKKLDKRNSDLYHKNIKIKQQSQQLIKNNRMMIKRQNTLRKAVQDLKNKKAHLKKYLHKKWKEYKEKHLKSFYKGLAIGINFIFKDGIKESYKLATGKRYKYWKSQPKKHYSGINLFLKGLKIRGNGFFKNYTRKSLDDSFKKNNHHKNRQNSDDLQL